MIRVGIAGWDYADWNGVVYPPLTGRGFDKLAWITRFVDAIEVNSSFYRPVRPQVAETWVRRTESHPDFRFAAKAHRSWTHEIEADLRAAVVETLAGLHPLHDAGRLGAILVQFPQRFHWNPGNADHVERLAGLGAGWPLVLEVRHRSWRADEVVEFLRGIGIGWCVVDQPRASGASIAALERLTSPVGYVRLHGRNAEQWFREEAGRDDRYDYLYTLSELAPLARIAADLATEAAEVFVIQNNHFRGQALANTLQLKHLFEGQRPKCPQRLVETYPDLEPLVDIERETLF
ncbi:MAG: DUF72 domain-containing protein [Acidobacteria bacterium]|nr:DUF72 domain-containing protein [Acidobacteriota bacterium]NIM64219.1 DUF72 domain-containing protein [Acidobacteriota bacterium]NIO59217.1 DUF72 domain-containing protein [Acidobacteriota bacterium]NIQ30244.1 DUF72 domain-containing protein [Acidobacteriota bacterium]NIQ85172.1 DUF72 domain-containing protein [Acidobacteriota bacterium]